MKRRFLDRRDATLIRELDGMHVIMPLIMPGRTSNEAFISERIDLTNLNAYLEKKNATNPEYHYNLFQAVVTIILKVLTLRPKMNRFIKNKYMYQRNDITAAFTIKKVFSDDGDEGLAFMKGHPEDNINTIHDKLYEKITSVRKEGDASSDAMDIISKLPRPVTKLAVNILKGLEEIDLIPKALVASDPFRASVVLSNLGSIKLQSGYHHLTNWGTTSLFVVIGEKKFRHLTDNEGNTRFVETVDLGLTVDERIADGYYYSKTMKLVRALFENPELLELPLSEEVEY